MYRMGNDMCLIIVSGCLGLGKSIVLNVFEDNGFYCIDNFFVSLFFDLVQCVLLYMELLQLQVVVLIDVCNLFSQLQCFFELLQEVWDNYINCDVLYFDVDDEMLFK